MAAFDAIIDCAGTNPKAIRDWADRQFCGLLERGHRDVMPKPNPFDPAYGEGFALGTSQTVRV
jgi:hypothetical protein